MLEGVSNKQLFDYWYGQVELRNYELIKSAVHVPTPRLRHECTNYDALRLRPDISSLDELERSRVIAIIKYECTARVLQRRAGILKDRAHKLDEFCREQEVRAGRLEALIRALQQKLFGKDQRIRRLEARISQLEMENEALAAERASSQAEIDVQRELQDLQIRVEAAEAKRWELTRRTQSLGGRLAHTTRYKRERDELREQLQLEQARNRDLTRRLVDLQQPQGLHPHS